MRRITQLSSALPYNAIFSDIKEEVVLLGDLIVELEVVHKSWLVTVIIDIVE